MKYFKSFLFVLFALISFSCDKGEPENTEPTPTPQPENKIEFTAGTDTNPVIPTDGGTITISFNASTAWTAQAINTRADNWCSIFPTSGNAGAATITITAKANNETDERSASIIINAGTATQSIKVNQKQKDALTITASTYEVPAEGQDISIEVKSNIDVTHRILDDSKGWIKYIGTRSIKTSILTFLISKNESVERREGKIIIGEGALADTITIFQIGEKPSIVLSKDEYTAKAEGETFSIEVASNVDVNIDILHPDGVSSWLSENHTKTMSTNTYYFTARANEDYDNRRAKIIFTCKENNISDTVNVTQLQKDALIITPKEQIIEAIGGTATIEIRTNVDFTVTNPTANWIHPIKTKGLTAYTLQYTVDANPGYDTREAKITIKNEKTGETENVTITQLQTNAIVIAKKNYELEYEGGLIEVEVASNVEFTYEIGAEWITRFETKALSKRIIEFVVSENTSGSNRETTIKFSSEQNQIEQIVNIKQNAKEIEQTEPASNEIWYTSKDGNVIEPAYKNVFGANIITNIYNNGKGIITFDAPVKTIGSDAFSKCTKLESIEIPDGVTSIGDRAFQQCTNLKSIAIPKSVTTIGKVAFSDCSILASLTIPDNATSIGLGAFQRCSSLTSIKIPENITTINDYTFSGCI